MTNFGSIMKGVFYLVLLVLGILLVWSVWSGFEQYRKKAYVGAAAFGLALRDALDPTKDTFFFWKIPGFSWMPPASKSITDKLKGWFGVPTGMPGGSVNPMNQSTTGEQAVLLGPNFPPSITTQVTPVKAQFDPVQQIATSNTGTSGNQDQTPIDNAFPVSVGIPIGAIQ